MIIHLVRHGETTGDVENRYGGAYDDHLTEIGKEQSAHLAERLVASEIEQLYASPLIRAQETGEIIAKRLGLVPTTIAGFRERNAYGALSGLTKDEAAQKYPEQVRLVKDPHNNIDGAEPYDAFQARITAALGDLTNLHIERAAVVTHGGPLHLIFRDILKLGEIQVDDCAHVVLDAADGKFSLVETNGVTILGISQV